MTSIAVPHHVNMTEVDRVQVNFARFFIWMDDAYGALLRELGHPLAGILATGNATPVVDARCEFRRPVGLDDGFVVRAAVTSVGRTSYVVTHRFDDEGGAFAIGRTTHVWITAAEEQASAPVPDWIRAAKHEAFLDEAEVGD